MPQEKQQPRRLFERISYPKNKPKAEGFYFTDVGERYFDGNKFTNEGASITFWYSELPPSTFPECVSDAEASKFWHSLKATDKSAMRMWQESRSRCLGLFEENQRLTQRIEQMRKQAVEMVKDINETLWRNEGQRMYSSDDEIKQLTDKFLTNNETR
jgi:hypothetical protein